MRWSQAKSQRQGLAGQLRHLGRAAGTESGGDGLCLPSHCQDEPHRARLLFALEDTFLAPSVQYVAVTLVTTP